MLLLSANNISKLYGDRAVLDGVELEIRMGDRLALVGPNGAGKTTLLRILTGEESSDSGDVEVHGSARLGYVRQHSHFAPNSTVWTEASKALGDLSELVATAEQVSHDLAANSDPVEHQRLLEQYELLQARILNEDAYNWKNRVERVLQGLGFAPSQYEQPAGELSGGQQNRLMLACLLLARPELMILDEPNNHLDVESTEWLEDTLAGWPGAVLVVSHDRYFLDRVANGVLELIDGTIDRFKGNYTAYTQQKELRLDVQRKTFERQQEEIEKLEDFIRRHHAGQKSTQAEDRRKKLERIERTERPREIIVPSFQFAEPSRTGDIVLRVEGLSKSFSRPLFERLSFQIQRGERWAIVGSNGAGKTTLLRCLLGQLPADNGVTTLGSGVKVGYFDQLVRNLDLDLPPIEAVRVPHRETVDLERRNLLASFGLAGEVVLKPLSTLSGGERNRTLLAYLAALDANFLVLDEPTNHLDLWSRQALEAAFRAFPGTILLVSHDRYLINKIADHLLIIRQGKCSVLHGNYDDYRHWLAQGMTIADRGAVGVVSKSSLEASAKGSPANGKASATTSQAATKRKRKFPYRKVELLEADIVEAEQKLESLQQQMLDPSVLRDGLKVKQIQSEIDKQQEAVSQLYAHYEEAVELNG